MDENNYTYYNQPMRNFTNIQIVEHTFDKNLQQNVLHNIYLNDVILHSADYLINHLNDIF